MIKIKDKINNIMDEIQIIMESNGHLNGEIEKLEELFSKVSIYLGMILPFLFQQNRSHILY